MNQTTCSPSFVHQVFNSLLAGTDSPNTSRTSEKNTSASTETAEPQRLVAPPPKNSLRFIESDQNGRREKYDGCRWRLVCTWNTHECTNIAYSNLLCTKHNAMRKNKEAPKRKRKPLLTHSSLPIMNQHNRKSTYDEDDDDIEIIEELCKAPKKHRPTNSNIKVEEPDFKVFSVDNIDNMDTHNTIKCEPKVSSSYDADVINDIEYVTSKIRTNGLNISELLSKNIPPLTEFEEEYIATRLIEKIPINSLMVDAQLFLHHEAISVVKRNYRIHMDLVAPEYFYDFILRHPRVALHFRKWFLRFKPVPPSTGCPIDTKAWTLSMIVRGAMASNGMNDECDD